MLGFACGSFQFVFKTTRKSSFCAKRSAVAESIRRILIHRRMDSATSRGMTADIFVALKWKSNHTYEYRISTNFIAAYQRFACFSDAFIPEN